MQAAVTRGSARLGRASAAARRAAPLRVAVAATRRRSVASASASQQSGGASTAVAADGSSTSKPTWAIRMLYDGDCPLCMKEVDFLKRRDAGRGRIDFVDIAAPAYRAADNAGVTFEAAMERIHAIEADGTVVTGVPVFRRLYEEVGLGWVYAATRNAAVGAAAGALYDAWARYRTQLTGREDLATILARRRAAEAAGRGDAGSLCGPDAAACDVPPPPAQQQEQQQQQQR